MNRSGPCVAGARALVRGTRLSLSGMVLGNWHATERGDAQPMKGSLMPLATLVMNLG